jgi:hypothetical protein
MNNQEKAQLLKDLTFHLGHYRDSRNTVIRCVARGKPILADADQTVGFHALRLAEILDLLNGSTR